MLMPQRHRAVENQVLLALAVSWANGALVTAAAAGWRIATCGRAGSSLLEQRFGVCQLQLEQQVGQAGVGSPSCAEQPMP